MRSRRRGPGRDSQSRQRHRPLERDRHLERDDAGGGYLEDEGASGSSERPAVLVADPRWVQPAELIGCDIDGCSSIAVPEAWELVDLDTGDEAPARFCEEHQMAWLTRPRPLVDATA